MMSVEKMKNGMVAGTLVHTDKGLVPIEQLKVGDMVLSKHESNTGEQAYKRVVSTFKSATRKPIMAVRFTSQLLEKIADDLGDYRVSLYSDSPDGKTALFDHEKYDVRAKEVVEWFEQKYQRSFDPDDVTGQAGGYHRRTYQMHLFCTDNHPFWVEGKGWTVAEQLGRLDQFQGYDGDTLELASFDAKAHGPLHQTSIPGIAAYFHFDYEKDYRHDLDNARKFIDFRFGKPTFAVPELTYKNLSGPRYQGYKIEDLLGDYRGETHPLENIYIRLNDLTYPAQISMAQQSLVDYSDCVDRPDFFNLTYDNGLEANSGLGESPRFEDYVYNIEVEDFHTYYVGYAGVWVKARNMKLRLVEPFIA